MSILAGAPSKVKSLVYIKERVVQEAITFLSAERSSTKSEDVFKTYLSRSSGTSKSKNTIEYPGTLSSEGIYLPAAPTPITKSERGCWSPSRSCTNPTTILFIIDLNRTTRCLYIAIFNSTTPGQPFVSSAWKVFATYKCPWLPKNPPAPGSPLLPPYKTLGELAMR